ncbi:hypothetical protein Hanom_Chr05g00394741 [Helianthus anomalus]
MNERNRYQPTSHDMITEKNKIRAGEYNIELVVISFATWCNDQPLWTTIGLKQGKMGPSASHQSFRLLSNLSIKLIIYFLELDDLEGSNHLTHNK